MSFGFGGLPYVDAVGWPDTVTLTQTYDFDSRTGGGGSSDGSYLTITGTATWTWTLVKLATYLQCPDLLCADLSPLLGSDADGDPVMNTGDLVVLQSGVGQMPGWQAFFGPQDPQTGAFEQTEYPAPGATDPATGNPAQPKVTMIDANAGVVNPVCAPAAPGRFLALPGDSENSNAFLAMNVGIEHDNAKGTFPGPVSVQQLQPGFPADAATKQPEIGPVYRLTIPTDALFLYSLTLTTSNGTATGDVTGNIGLAEALTNVGLSYQPNTPASVIQSIVARSPWVADVALIHASDAILSASLEGYFGWQQGLSQLFFGSTIQTIDDPFSMPGQTFTDDNTTESNGFTTTLQF